MPRWRPLRDWMVTGGVLMTGDHANPRQSGHDANLDNLLGLGRAIAHRVPRAGALRRWEGGPPQDDEEPVVASPFAVGNVGQDRIETIDRVSASSCCTRLHRRAAERRWPCSRAALLARCRETHSSSMTPYSRISRRRCQLGERCEYASRSEVDCGAVRQQPFRS
jgi:hypothetical protein